MSPDLLDAACLKATEHAQAAETWAEWAAVQTHGSRRESMLKTSRVHRVLAELITDQIAADFAIDKKLAAFHRRTSRAVEEVLARPVHQAARLN